MTNMRYKQRALLRKMFYTSDTCDFWDKFQVCSEKTFLPSERPSSQCASQWVQFLRSYYFTNTWAGLLFSNNFCHMDGLLLLLASSSFLLKRSYSSPAKEVVIALLARVNQFVGRDALSLFPQGTIRFKIQPQYTSLDPLHAKSVTSDCFFCVFPPSRVPSSHTLSMAKSVWVWVYTLYSASAVAEDSGGKQSRHPESESVAGRRYETARPQLFFRELLGDQVARIDGAFQRSER